MNIVEKRMARIRALARVTHRKYGLPLHGGLLSEYAALSRLLETGK